MTVGCASPRHRFLSAGRPGVYPQLPSVGSARMATAHRRSLRHHAPGNGPPTTARRTCSPLPPKDRP